MTKTPLIITVAISVLLFANVGLVYAQAQQDTLEVFDFLPPFEGFRWGVSGFADYGHRMTIASIVIGQNRLTYHIEGEVDDLSGGESRRDYSFVVSYVVQSDRISQETNGETLLDSKWEQMEILRAPIEEGASWQQNVGETNEATTLHCTIESIEGERGERVLKIFYRDVEGPYYESREIQEHKGVMGFERLMLDGEEPYEVTYTALPQATLLPPAADFVDVTSQDWFIPYLGAPQRMGLIRGYPDGSFRSDRSISVAEFIKTVVAVLGHRIISEEEPWYLPHVRVAEDMGLVRSGEFQDYDRPIRRKEMAMLLVRAVETSLSGDENATEFIDSQQIGSYFESYVVDATETGLLKGYPDGSFRPREAMTRAEAVRVLWSLIYNVDYDVFRSEAAITLEEEFEDRLYQDTIPDDEPLPRVEDFDRIEDLIDHLAQIMDRELASSYVMDYYEERSDRLYLIPKDGPVLLRADEDFELRMLTPTEYQLTQESSSELVGDYVLTITYQQRGDRWIILDREVTLED